MDDWPYTELGLLGQGSCAKVTLGAERATGRQVAVKAFDKTAGGDHIIAQARAEIDALSACDHPNIVKLFAVYEDSIDIRLVLEYVSFGELYDFVAIRGRLNEDEARPLFDEIVGALHYLHSNGMCHRDIKLENILLDSTCHVKLVRHDVAHSFSPLSERSGNDSFRTLNRAIHSNAFSVISE